MSAFICLVFTVITQTAKLVNHDTAKYVVNRSKVHFTITEPSLQLSKMSIYNVSGKLVAMLSNKAGSGEYIWERTGLS